MGLEYSLRISVGFKVVALGRIQVYTLLTKANNINQVTQSTKWASHGTALVGFTSFTSIWLFVKGAYLHTRQWLVYFLPFFFFLNSSSTFGHKWIAIVEQGQSLNQWLNHWIVLFPKFFLEFAFQKKYFKHISSQRQQISSNHTSNPTALVRWDYTYSSSCTGKYKTKNMFWFPPVKIWQFYAFVHFNFIYKFRCEGAWWLSVDFSRYTINNPAKTWSRLWYRFHWEICALQRCSCSDSIHAKGNSGIFRTGAD